MMDNFPEPEGIHRSAEEGDIESINRFLKAGGDPNTQDEYGQSLLTIAILHQNLRVAELLKESGARTDLEDNAGLTPAHYLLLASNDALSKLLL